MLCQLASVSYSKVESKLAVKRLFELRLLAACGRVGLAAVRGGVFVPATAGYGRRPQKQGWREPDLQTRRVRCQGSALFCLRVDLSGGRGERSVGAGARTRPVRSFCGGVDRVL